MPGRLIDTRREREKTWSGLRMASTLRASSCGLARVCTCGVKGVWGGVWMQGAARYCGSRARVSTASDLPIAWGTSPRHRIVMGQAGPTEPISDDGQNGLAGLTNWTGEWLHSSHSTSNRRVGPLEQDRQVEQIFFLSFLRDCCLVFVVWEPLDGETTRSPLISNSRALA